ncbi:hypothetical protein TNCV_4172071 [Trichonephila clavipes]|nr:hypothetical protein TNCV_4172071 [Trichonephila clavipes]
MIGQIYRGVTLEQQLHLFWGPVGAEFVFMDDNARHHRPNKINECLQSERISPVWTGHYSHRSLQSMCGTCLTEMLQSINQLLPELFRPLIEE